MVRLDRLFSAYSRDQRSDCRQIGIAVVLSPEGIPLAHEIMPGNTSDKTTLKAFLEKIQAQYGQAKRIWIMDRGIPTEAILKDMRQSDPPVSYLVGTPRDLFDVRGLFERGGLTTEVVECFVCYLAGHNRPVHEVLFSRDVNMSSAFENEFAGMTRNPITLAELQQVRRKLKKELPAVLTLNQRQFLLGLVTDEPDWQLMKCPHLSQLPAIRWKLQNLAKLKKSNLGKFTQQAEELRARLAV